MVGDRGMITSARITALREAGDLGWLTCLRAPQIAALAKDDGPLQLSLFDESDLAEFSHPDYPGERLIACRNPVLAEERKRKRAELLVATEEILAPVISAVREGRLVGAARIGLKVGKVINKFKMAKHFELSIGESTLSVSRKEDAIAAEAALDGIYVLRTTIKKTDLDAPGVVDAYKALSHVERDFRPRLAPARNTGPAHFYRRGTTASRQPRGACGALGRCPRQSRDQGQRRRSRGSRLSRAPRAPGHAHPQHHADHHH
jgi:hypothetical protein